MGVTKLNSKKKEPMAEKWQKDIYRVFGISIPTKLKYKAAAKTINELSDTEENIRLIEEIKSTGIPTFNKIVKSITFAQIEKKSRCLNTNLQIRNSNDSNIEKEKARQEKWERRISTYTESYKHFLVFFRDVKEIKNHHLVIGANIAYGWMPRVLVFQGDEFETCAKILNDASGNEQISETEIRTLVRLIDSSLVGASKLLHFVNPEAYAIWDSQVCKFISGKKGKSTYDKLENYLAYLNLCKRISTHERYADIHKQLEKHTGYEISAMRAIEQIMFLNSNSPIVRDVMLETIRNQQKTPGNKTIQMTSNSISNSISGIDINNEV